MEDHQHRIAFAGTPNSGKTTLFNVLTGMRHKVGNFPGVTIEPATGQIRKADIHADVIDLPGTYSLSPKSPDEELTLAVLQGKHPQIECPRAIVFIADATNLEKSLFLYSQIAEQQLPCIMVITMIDAVKARGGVLDDIFLEHTLGIPVITIVGHKGIGITEVSTAILENHFQLPQPPVPGAAISQRMEWARSIAQQAVQMQEQDTITERLDRILLHPLGGALIFLTVMALFFQSIFTWATPLMDGIEGIFTLLQEQTQSILPPGIFSDFITRGLIAGVGSVLVFLPQIILLNILIVLLEDCGYLARGAFLVDRIMGLFGLQGRSFIPLLGSFACAIPGIMSARIIPSEKERMTTMMIAPLMTCSARLPVYTLLISAFIPATFIAGFISLQALVLAGLYFLAAISGLLIAAILKKTFFAGDKLPFLLEFPPYRIPSLRSLIITVIDRSREFLRSAGTVIVVLSIILWALSAFPRAELSPDMPPLMREKVQLEQSYAGMLGKAIEPVFRPIGFDWKLSIGVIGSFAAREVFVTVMGQLYNADTSQDDSTLRAVLQQSVPIASALAVLAFYVYALQCISTMAILKRETGSWKWPAIAFAYTFALAYGAAYAVYTITLACIKPV
jgi:ferrous iron transport protein B